MDYAQSATKATAMLTKFGQSVTRRSYTAGTYNPATGTVTPTTADTTRKGVKLDYASGQTTERGNLIQVSDKRLYLDAAGPVSLQDHFIVGGVEYVVISLGEINPAGTPVLYDIHVRA
jgi:hypothetical protein